jgi:hypothetical protein
MECGSEFAMHAGASAAAWTCGDSVAIAEVEVTATALAKAVAEAYSYAYAECKADDGWFCADSDTIISTDWVEAVVRAWAGGWAGAYTCTDTCSVEIEVVVDAVSHIMVVAVTDAYADVCGDGAPLCLCPFQLLYRLNTCSACTDITSNAVLFRVFPLS